MRIWLLTICCFTCVACAKKGTTGGSRGSSSSRTSSSRSGTGGSRFTGSFSRAGGNGFSSRSSSTSYRDSDGYYSRIYSYARPAGNSISPIQYSPGTPIISHYNSYLLINDNHYYWNVHSYKKIPSRPVRCQHAFNVNDEMFQDIFLTNDPAMMDDNTTDISNTTLIEGMEQEKMIFRPKEIIYDCFSDEFCCDIGCCSKLTWAIYYLICAIVIIIIIVFIIIQCQQCGYCGLNKLCQDEAEVLDENGKLLHNQ